MRRFRGNATGEALRRFPTLGGREASGARGGTGTEVSGAGVGTEVEVSGAEGAEAGAGEVAALRVKLVSVSICATSALVGRRPALSVMSFEYMVVDVTLHPSPPSIWWQY